MRNCLLLLACLFTLLVQGARYRVQDFAEWQQRLPSLTAGDTVILASGEWKNAAFIINTKATAASPLVVMAETPGQVRLTGNSSLQLGGSYIIVSGLCFINGFNPAGPAISFRSSPRQLAMHCRVTETRIDGYNNPDRLRDDHWVALYGRHNRFDHNYISGKKNMGTTLVVELNDTANQQNFHRIDHNYFGPRLRLGSNGGETIRIGTSTYSRTSSNTLIEDNFFDRCSGEVEIISIKSCDNILRRNTFWECEGGLVLRHGNRNRLEENFFLGNDREHTGGIRVINAGHIIRGNVFHRLAGERFRSALAILNGVPNSPINRYDPVRDVQITGNLFVDCRNIEFCAGKDFERTAIPENVDFRENLFYNSGEPVRFTVNDNIRGIRLLNNQFNKGPIGWKAGGFRVQPFSVQLQNGAFVLNGTTREPFATRTNTGPSWYVAKAEPTSARRTGRLIGVLPGDNTLPEMLRQTAPGDTLLLGPGIYSLSQTLSVRHPLTILSRETGDDRPLLQFSGQQGGFSFFSIENGGSLRLQGLRCNGLSPNAVAESFIRTSLQPMLEHYTLFADRCDFEQITDGRKHAFKANKGSFADTIQFTNCRFEDISGEVISIAAEKEDRGVYNAEVVVFRNCFFRKILVGAIDLYRGGNDESTTGPYFYMDHCTFVETGNVELCSVVRLFGVQFSRITNSLFYNSGRAGRSVWYEDFGWTKHLYTHNSRFSAGGIVSVYPNIIRSPNWTADPLFRNEKNGDYRLQTGSPLRNRGTDKKDIGALWNGDLLTDE